ncbi:branched-chain amino acid ABC transporter permease [Frankia sp. AiPs1]|uniref:branched-chain amino acid ABC transporter permease n=1 Tax=Frankia sp. AiPs1 TaxID=573493 RepID=UPI002043FE66|nr:branched-chain amino acid ABC transporter permease [Frankia sp. AiPs1]MCM3920509.1 branched-chain amino acid ABC transporter permease [Frankia sp. AiPs1]
MTQQLVNAIALGSIYTLFSLGLTLSWGILNVLNLAHGAIFTAGTMFAFLLTEHAAGLPFAVVLAAALVGSALLAVLMEAVAFAPIRARSGNALDAEMRTLIASVAVASIIVTVVGIQSDHQPYALPQSLLERHRYDVLGVHVSNVQILVLVAAIVLSALLVLFVRRSRYGRAMRAVAFDRTAAGMVGISARTLQLAAMALSGALAGVAGVLLAVYLGAADAHMGDSFLLKAFAIIILAGVGSLEGAVFFAYALALVETLVGYYLGGDVRDALAFVLIVVILVLRPQGLAARQGWQRA